MPPDYAQIPGGLNIQRSVDTLSTNHVAGDYALSGGFGTTASVAVTLGNDSRAVIVITSAGTGQGASPTCTLTFKDGAFPVAPVVLAQMGAGSQPTIPIRCVPTTTAVVMTFQGMTPVAAETYTVNIIIRG